MAIELLITEYEHVRTEINYYSKSQITILLELITVCTVVFGYYFDFEKEGHENLIALASGFIIPAIFAFLGVLWINQVYHQRQLAYYSLMLEREIGNPKGVKIGIETFNKKYKNSSKKSKFSIGHACKIMKKFIKRLFLSANYYYYVLTILGLVITPCSFCYYCKRQVAVLENNSIEYSNLCYLGRWITIVFIIIMFIYILEIVKLHYNMNEMDNKSKSNGAKKPAFPGDNKDEVVI